MSNQMFVEVITATTVGGIVPDFMWLAYDNYGRTTGLRMSAETFVSQYPTVGHLLKEISEREEFIDAFDVDLDTGEVIHRSISHLDVVGYNEFIRGIQRGI